VIIEELLSKDIDEVLVDANELNKAFIIDSFQGRLKVRVNFLVELNDLVLPFEAIEHGDEKVAQT
jgi:hypothetical protein